MKRQPVNARFAMRILALGLAAYGIVGLHAAQAQLIQQNFPTDIPGYEPSFNASVVNRMILQDQSDGVEVDDAVIRPQISQTGGYNSNTLGAPNTGSGELLTQAGLRTNLDWPRDNFGVSLNVLDHRYTDLPEANYTDWNAGVGGGILLGNDTLTLGYSHLVQHLTATDLGQTGVLTPVPFSVDDLRLAYEKLFGRFSLTPGFTYDNFQFGKSDGAFKVNDQALNHQVETERLSGRYELAPGEGLIGIVRTSQAQFGNSPHDDYFDATIFAGLDYTPPAIIQYRVLAAFETRRFRANSSPTINTPAFELDAIWTPTELDTVTASAFRQAGDPASAFQSNQVVTNLRGEIDHELRTDVFLNAFGQYGHSVSQSSTAGVSNGTDTQFTVGAAAWWNINRHLSLKLSDNVLHSKSSGGLANTTNAFALSSFTSNTILLGFRLYD